jgi:AcrR family transcriptional regulator
MPKTLTRPDIEEFREKLCVAASRLFAEHGREGFSMRELASALGVSAMTPYRYFRDKEAILAAVRARAFNRFAEALEAAYASTDNALARSRTVGLAYVRFAIAEPFSYRLMFDLSQPGEDRYPELVDATGRARATMTRHVIPLVEQGILAGDPKLIGHVMWASLHGAVVLELAGKLTPDCGFDRIIEESFTALFQGFAAKRITV